MSDSTIKNLKVTGDAADSFLKRGGHLTRKRGRKSSRADRDQEGGTSPGTIVQIQANRAPSSIASVPNSGNASNLAKTVTESTPATTAQEQTLKGGVQEKHKPVKVVLAAGKSNKNVVLAPAKVKKVITGTTQNQKTRKIAKRIRMSIGGLSKRVTRANHIRGESRKQDILAIKKTLVEAKLIKLDTKAPEAILRSMYSDYMMLKNKAL
jgi:hypothetical protein